MIHIFILPLSQRRIDHFAWWIRRVLFSCAVKLIPSSSILCNFSCFFVLSSSHSLLTLTVVVIFATGCGFIYQSPVALNCLGVLKRTFRLPCIILFRESLPACQVLRTISCNLVRNYLFYWPTLFAHAFNIITRLRRWWWWWWWSWWWWDHRLANYFHLVQRNQSI